MSNKESSASSPAPSPLSPYLDAVANIFHPVASPVLNSYNLFHGWKESMGLVQPGTAENLTKEVQQVHLANWFFDGARADISKVVSANPAFQLTHTFSLGSSSRPPAYNFGAIFANANTFLHGSVDGQGQVTARANQTWSPHDISKLQAQLTNKPAQTMVQIEHDHLAPHYTFSLKSMNPGLLDGTGIHFVSLLHSIGPRLSLGFETIIQNTSVSKLETSTSYLAKLTSLPDRSAAASAALSPLGGPPIAQPFSPSWIATAQLQPSGNVQATYYQKMSDKVDVALDLQTNFQPASPLGPSQRGATATLGAKYDFRPATFRAQVDSNMKVGMLLEQRFTPAFAFLVGGEIDHARNTSRFGVGIQIESTTM
ncbi:mitochondrial import receptor subunit TOM40 [Tremella mesenterica]|uniref:Mitochondrial import receptor subunit TOM40 n=1 Tax=Tremella mesenterica TaxID=5217 RepID=A0A4V1M3A8_TREME|nr:mitochondrial import receptor subunit TOM40 [Tremella mesenterica]